MATYASYRHIELDKVGYTKKRVNSQSSEIYNVLCTPPSTQMSKPKSNGHNGHTPSRTDSFNRLFGNTPDKPVPRRNRSSDLSPRNPVTGDGVTSWDHRPGSKSTPRTPKVSVERNPVTGETYIISPVSTPVKKMNGHHEMNGNGITKMNGNAKMNGFNEKLNGHGHEKTNGHTIKENGHPKMNGHSQQNGHDKQNGYQNGH